MDEIKIGRALFSLTDKRGSVEFALGLARHGVEIISTGGTASHLRDGGVTVTDVSQVTGFPEIMGGRIKTLHPAVHGGLLAVRDDPTHRREAEEARIDFIDLLVVNLYAFEETVARDGVTRDEAMENVDIGGPAMIRSAAKNHRYVAVVVDPARYGEILAEMEESGGSLGLKTRESLAAVAFALTASYDRAITRYLETTVPASEGDSTEGELPAELAIRTEPGTILRYGENPHLRAAFYTLPGSGESCAASAELLNGKALSYNNIIDIDAAYELVKEFDDPGAAVIKHTNPCGAATSSDIVQAYRDALEGDPLSAFGGILALNRPFTGELAEEVATKERFFEAIIAPGCDADAVAVVSKKVKWGRNCRILAAAPLDREQAVFKKNTEPGRGTTVRSVVGGFILQDRDLGFEDEKFEIVTQAVPDDDLKASLLFAWKVVKHVKSNAIVLARDMRVVGVGAGQMSRIDSTMIAGRKAGEKAKGSVLGSDAFFPFRDCVDMASDLGVRAIIQPGGSVRDKESIAAADEHGIAMVFTGRRHFRH